MGKDDYIDPTKLGMPSFDEFAKNPEKYMGREDDRLSEADVGASQVKHLVKRHIYEIEGYRCKTLEEVERVARNQGIPIRELDYRPSMVQAGAGKYDIIVKFVPKEMAQVRNEWNRKRLRG